MKMVFNMPKFCRAPHALLLVSLLTAGTAVHATLSGPGLMSLRDCRSCHRVDPPKPGEAITLGPPFKLVAERYRYDKTAQDKLVKKILAGGNGQWGRNNMPPQILTEDEAHILVRWILKLK